MQKEVFQADDNGLFLYQTLANELALTPGKFNIPFGAYEDAPPQPAQGRWPRRVGDAWTMVEDYRTTPLWVVESGAPYTIGTEHAGVDGNVSYPGWGPLPAWLTEVAPKPPASQPVTAA